MGSVERVGRVGRGVGSGSGSGSGTEALAEAVTERGEVSMLHGFGAHSPGIVDEL